MRSTAVPWVMLLAPMAAAQDAPPADTAQEPPAVALPAQPAVWELSASVFYSDPPGSDDRLTPIVYAERDALHLELRYNYEDLQTAAFFAGWTFEHGDDVALALTPMLGAVAGDTDGIAPALELDLAWQRLSWYGESEYLFDLDDSDDDFFYSWSTLTYGLTDWVSAGMVIERSKLVDTGLSVQRGLALEFQKGSLGLSLYAYNLFDSGDSYAVVALDLAP